MLEEVDDRYEFHRYNVKNLIMGEWLDSDEEDIYSVLLEGIRITNYIFEKKYSNMPINLKVPYFQLFIDELYMI